MTKGLIARFQGDVISIIQWLLATARLPTDPINNKTDPINNKHYRLWMMEEFFLLVCIFSFWKIVHSLNPSPVSGLWILDGGVFEAPTIVDSIDFVFLCCSFAGTTGIARAENGNSNFSSTILYRESVVIYREYFRMG